MQDSIQYIYTAIIASTFVFLILFFFFLGAIHKWRTQKIKQIEKDKLIGEVYEFKISESEIHAQESTLNFVGKELHDRVGLTLTLAKLNLNNTLSKLPIGITNDFENIEKTISEAIVELKEISMGLNSDLINEYGLIHSIENEIARINRSTNKYAEYDILGIPFELNNDYAIAIVRVIQELLNNLIKYSDTKKIMILLEFEEKFLQVSVVDDGAPNVRSNLKTYTSGLINIKHRLTFLNSKLEYNIKDKQNITFFKIHKP